MIYRLGYVHIWLVAAAVFILLIFGALIYFNTFHPDLVTTGSTLTAIFLAAFTILKRPIQIVYDIGKSVTGSIIPFLDQTRWSFSILSILCIIFALYGSFAMLTDFIDRYRYVNTIRQAINSLTSESSALPDTNVLADSYLRFPGRKEVPSLLVRTGRIFSQGGEWKDFVSYQQSYAEKLFNGYNNKINHCSLQGIDHDPVSYVAITYLESSVRLAKGIPKGDMSFIERAKQILEFLSNCQLEKSSNVDGYRKLNIQRMIYSTRIKSVIASLSPDKSDQNHDNFQEILSVEKYIDQLDASEKIWLFQSHVFQEFLDFKIKTNITNADPDKTIYSDDEIQLIIEDIRRLLSLRITISIDDDIRWIQPPGKLDTYRLFMVKGGYFSTKKKHTQ